MGDRKGKNRKGNRKMKGRGGDLIKYREICRWGIRTFLLILWIRKL